MNNKLKHILSAVFAVTFMLCTVTSAAVPSFAKQLDESESSVGAGGLTLADLKAKFPNGCYWNHIVNSSHRYVDYEDYGTCNNPDGYTWSPCYSHNANAPVGQCDCNTFAHAMQCAGFAKKISYDVYGSYPTSWGTTNVWNCKPGDVIHYGVTNENSNGHWVMVIARNGNTLTFGECNANTLIYGGCRISWDRTLDIGSLNGQIICYSAPYTLPTQKSDVDLGDDFYGLIINQPTWKSIGQADNGNVQIISESRETYNRVLWHFTKNSDGSYKIISMLNGKSLDVDNAADADGTNVKCYTYDGNNAQKWRFKNKDSMMVLTADCTSRILTVNGGSSVEGTNVQMFPWWDSTGQNIVVYKVTSENKLNYNITADKTEILKGETAKVSIGGSLPYTYNYKYHIINPSGKETIVDNQCNPTYNFAGDSDGVYTIYAEVKNPYYTDKGSASNRSVKIKVGCIHSYTDEFVESDGKSQGYVLHTCSKCGDTYKDSYMDYKDGYYYTDKVPTVITDDNYNIECYNYYEKIQKNSPGSDWKNEGVVKNEWQNKGSQYTTNTPLATSDSRVLVAEGYYHWCIPNGAKDSEGNYEQTSKFAHYDSIALPNNYIHVTWQGTDNGIPVYTLAWENGSAVYCKSGEQCDGSFGTHDYRCKAWYKYYVYQDREKVELYKYTKNSGWVTAADSSATKVTYRIEEKYKPYDVNLDGKVDVSDVTLLQMYIANLSTLTDKQLKAADANGDGDISIADVTAIQMAMAS